MIGGVAATPNHAAASGDPSGFTLLGALVQMIGALGVVAGVILLTYAAARKWMRFVSPSSGMNRYIRVVETRYLAPRNALLLVEVGGKYLLIGSSPTGFVFLREIDMLEDIEIVDDGGRKEKGAGMPSFREMLSRFGREGGR